MAAERAEIRHLRVRVPDLGREEAGRLGADVARHLAQILPGQRDPRHLGALHVGVRVTTGMPAGELVARIAQAIARGIGR